jgi:hypothetical protein
MRRRYLHWIVMAVLLGGCVAPRPLGLSSTAQPPRAEPSQTGDAPPGAPLPGSLAYLDFTNGFRDLTFGDEPMPDMQLTERKGDTTLYRRPRDELTFGGASLRDFMTRSGTSELHKLTTDPQSARDVIAHRLR